MTIGTSRRMTAMLAFKRPAFERSAVDERRVKGRRLVFEPVVDQQGVVVLGPGVIGDLDGVRVLEAKA